MATIDDILAKWNEIQLHAKLDAVLERVRTVSRADADFKESDHPRNSDGEFSSGGGGGKSYVGTTYRFAGQPDDPAPVGKHTGSSSGAEKNGGYGGAGVDKHGNRIQHAWEKEPRAGDHPITPPPSSGGQKPAATPAVAPKTASTPAPQSSKPTSAVSPSSGGKSKAPFVNEFMKASKNAEEDMNRLSQMSDEKLQKALKLLTDNRINDEDAVYMKELIRHVLKSSK
jgi:hypothetical protein